MLLERSQEGSVVCRDRQYFMIENPSSVCKENKPLRLWLCISLFGSKYFMKELPGVNYNSEDLLP